MASRVAFFITIFAASVCVVLAVEEFSDAPDAMLPSHAELMQIKTTTAFVELASLYSASASDLTLAQVAPSVVHESTTDKQLMVEQARTRVFQAASKAGMELRFNMDELMDATKDKDPAKATAAAAAYKIQQDAAFKCKDLKMETYKQCTVGLCKYHGECGDEAAKKQCDQQARVYERQEKIKERLNKARYAKVAMEDQKTAQESATKAAEAKEAAWKAGAKAREAKQKVGRRLLQSNKAEKTLANSPKCKTAAANSFNECQQLTTQQYAICGKLFEAAAKSFAAWKHPSAPPAPVRAPVAAPAPHATAESKAVEAKASVAEALQTASKAASRGDLASATAAAAAAVAATNKETRAAADAAEAKLKAEQVHKAGPSLYQQQESLFEEEVTPSVYDQEEDEFNKEVGQAAFVDAPPPVESLYDQEADEYEDQISA